MGDLISREALIEKLEEYIEYDTFDSYKEEPLICLGFEQLEDIICSQPTVEAVPVVHGKWFGNTCSACCLNWDENMVNNADDWGYFEPMPNFCPNCGADMRTSAE